MGVVWGENVPYFNKKGDGVPSFCARSFNELKKKSDVFHYLCLLYWVLGPFLGSCFSLIRYCGGLTTWPYFETSPPSPMEEYSRKGRKDGGLRTWVDAPSSAADNRRAWKERAWSPTLQWRICKIMMTPSNKSTIAQLSTWWQFITTTQLTQYQMIQAFLSHWNKNLYPLHY